MDSAVKAFQDMLEKVTRAKIEKLQKDRDAVEADRKFGFDNKVSKIQVFKDELSRALADAAAEVPRAEESNHIEEAEPSMIPLGNGANSEALRELEELEREVDQAMAKLEEIRKLMPMRVTAILLERQVPRILDRAESSEQLVGGRSPSADKGEGEEEASRGCNGTDVGNQATTSGLGQLRPEADAYVAADVAPPPETDRHGDADVAALSEADQRANAAFAMLQEAVNAFMEARSKGKRVEAVVAEFKGTTTTSRSAALDGDNGRGGKASQSKLAPRSHPYN